MTSESIEAYQPLIRQLDAKLKPIATRPIDTTQRDWPRRLAEDPRPLDEAGVRAEAERVVTALAEFYVREPESRPHIRHVFKRYPSFGWAAWPDRREPMTQSLFRSFLLYISMRDLSEDPRDIFQTLLHICGRARAAGVDVGPEIESVALISSEQVRKIMFDGRIV